MSRDEKSPFEHGVIFVSAECDRQCNTKKTGDEQDEDGSNVQRLVEFTQVSEVTLTTAITVGVSSMYCTQS